MPDDAVKTTLGLQSSIRIANSLGANPPKTTECVTPILAQANIAKAASGIMGMYTTAVSPAFKPKETSPPAN